MGTTPIRPLVDRVLDGQLDEILHRYVSEGLSPTRMSLRLASEYQVEVGAQTIRKWVAALPAWEVVGAQSAQTRHAIRTPLTSRAAQTARTAPTARTIAPHVAVAS